MAPSYESRVGSLVRWVQPGSGRRHGLVLSEDKERLQVAPIVAASPGEAEGEIFPLEPSDLPELAGTVVEPRGAFWAPAGQFAEIGRAPGSLTDRVLRSMAKSVARSYHRFAHDAGASRFVPGTSPVPVSGRVFGPEEIEHLVDASLDFWLTTGRFNEAFEKRLADFVGVRHVLTTNSGSSANLLAISSLTSPKLGDRRLVPGDEVITVAAGFPTTVNPLLQNGLVPVFVDIDIPTYNARPELIEKAVTSRTRAIVLAHTLGNPFDVEAILRVVKKHHLWLVEDCCDALGSRYRLPPDLATDGGADRLCGTFGHLATFSFYPAHHITMGEGGAVATRDARLKTIVESFRDWGRDCWCEPGHENTCGKRFSWKLGDLPEGYDHKYIYSHMGYNLKPTDMQAAVALAQLDRLETFIAARRRNFELLHEGLSGLDDHLILPEPTRNSTPSWFGFPLTVRGNARGGRDRLIARLYESKVATRLLFGGNLTKQPYFQGRTFRVASALENSDTVMERTFWLGVYPGLGRPHLEHVVDVIRSWAGNG